MTKISAVIPDELVAALKERARAEDRSMGAEVRRALTQHLANMVSVTTGERYSLDPFHELYGRQDRPRYEQFPLPRSAL